jgi:hypothetical protein
MTTLHNRGRTPASILVTTIRPRVPEEPPGVVGWHDVGGSAAEGLQFVPLAGEVATEVTPGWAVVAISTVTLTPGVSLRLPATSGPRMLAFERGHLEIHATGTWPLITGGTHEMSRYAADGALAAGDGALLHRDTDAELRNPGPEPVEVLVVAIRPAL